MSLSAWRIGRDLRASGFQSAVWPRGAPVYHVGSEMALLFLDIPGLFREWYGNPWHNMLRAISFSDVLPENLQRIECFFLGGEVSPQRFYVLRPSALRAYAAPPSSVPFTEVLSQNAMAELDLCGGE